MKKITPYLIAIIVCVAGYYYFANLKPTDPTNALLVYTYLILSGGFAGGAIGAAAGLLLALFAKKK